MSEPEHPDNPNAPDSDTAIHAEQIVDDLEERMVGWRPDTRRDAEESDAPAIEQDLDGPGPERGPGSEPP